MKTKQNKNQSQYLSGVVFFSYILKLSKKHFVSIFLQFDGSLARALASFPICIKFPSGCETIERPAAGRSVVEFSPHPENKHKSGRLSDRHISRINQHTSHASSSSSVFIYCFFFFYFASLFFFCFFVLFFFLLIHNRCNQLIRFSGGGEPPTAVCMSTKNCSFIIHLS